MFFFIASKPPLIVWLTFIDSWAQFAGVAPSLARQETAAAFGFGVVKGFGYGAFSRFKSCETEALTGIWGQTHHFLIRTTNKSIANIDFEILTYCMTHGSTFLQKHLKHVFLIFGSYQSSVGHYQTTRNQAGRYTGNCPACFYRCQTDICWAPRYTRWYLPKKTEMRLRDIRGRNLHVTGGQIMPRRTPATDGTGHRGSCTRVFLRTWGCG